jgi:XTP/dITP diphosphohydrolase
MQLVFASNNKHKVGEVSQMLGQTFELKTLNEIGCHEEIPEPYPTLEQNALAKARFVFQKFGLNCFADDTGLEVDALGGMPGVISARYAGENASFEDNCKKLLYEMKEKSDRKAKFRAVFALIVDGNEFLFEGEVNGKITNEPFGEKGFGYDPVFIPDGYSQTFAQMSAELKNTISHRYHATRKLVEFLKSTLLQSD